MDLTMNDPATGEPWDLSKQTVQSRVLKLIRDVKPFCVIGSPPCTTFSPFQEISRARRDPKMMEAELRNGKNHVRFCIEVYRLQLQGRRHFVHEHPEKSKAWDMPEIIELMAHSEVGSVVLHMCAFGMASTDEQGEAQ